MERVRIGVTQESSNCRVGHSGFKGIGREARPVGVANHPLQFRVAFSECGKSKPNRVPAPWQSLRVAKERPLGIPRHEPFCQVEGVWAQVNDPRLAGFLGGFVFEKHPATTIKIHVLDRQTPNLARPGPRQRQRDDVVAEGFVLDRAENELPFLRGEDTVANFAVRLADMRDGAAGNVLLFHGPVERPLDCADAAVYSRGAERTRLHPCVDVMLLKLGDTQVAESWLERAEEPLVPLMGRRLVILMAVAKEAVEDVVDSNPGLNRGDLRLDFASRKLLDGDFFGFLTPFASVRRHQESDLLLLSVLLHREIPGGLGFPEPDLLHDKNPPQGTM